jgi:hypothetical protein
MNEGPGDGAFLFLGTFLLVGARRAASFLSEKKMAASFDAAM